MGTTCPTSPLDLGSLLGAVSRSITMGRTPASASSQASIIPLGPPPTMTTSMCVSSLNEGTSKQAVPLLFYGLSRFRQPRANLVEHFLKQRHNRPDGIGGPSSQCRTKPRADHRGDDLRVKIGGGGPGPLRDGGGQLVLG